MNAGLCDLRHDSLALGRKARLTVLFPQAAGPFPALYLLHGYGGDAESWTRDFALQSLAADRRFLIVMPEGGLGYYLNDPRPGGAAWEDHVLRDTVGLVERLFPARRERAARAVAGLSMGGYGAFRLALSHPDMFGAAISLSGSLYFGSGPHPRGDPARNALMAAAGPEASDLFRLAAALPAGRRPRLAFDCGTEDDLLAFNREFHAHLERLNYPHEYAECPGGHNAAYWSGRLPDTLDAIGRYFAERQPAYG